MLRQIDALRRYAHGAERRVDGGGGRRDEREYRAVVRCVGVNVEQRHGRHRRQRGAQTVERRVVAALGKVRYALDERSGHGYTSMRNAECGVRSVSRGVRAPDTGHGARPASDQFRIPHSALRTLSIRILTRFLGAPSATHAFSDSPPRSTRAAARRAPPRASSPRHPPPAPAPPPPRRPTAPARAPTSRRDAPRRGRRGRPPPSPRAGYRSPPPSRRRTDPGAAAGRVAPVTVTRGRRPQAAAVPPPAPACSVPPSRLRC